MNEDLRLIAHAAAMMLALRVRYGNGHREGCVRIVSGGGESIRCDCGLEALIADMDEWRERVGQRQHPILKGAKHGR